MNPLELKSKIQNFSKLYKAQVTDRLAQTTAGQFPGELAKNLGKTAVGIGQGIAKAPLNLANTAYDLTQQVQGKEPSMGYDVPGLGHVQGYGREALNNTPEQGPLAAGIGAVSHGILDTVGTAAIASKAVPALNTPLTNSPVKGLLNNLKSSTTDWDASIQSGDIPKEQIYNSDGTFTPEATKHVLSDMAEKMNIHLSKGLGDKFLSKVDTLKSSPSELLKQASDFIKSTYSQPGIAAAGNSIGQGIKELLKPQKAEAVSFGSGRDASTANWPTDTYGDTYKSPYGSVGTLYTPEAHISTQGPQGQSISLPMDQFVNKNPVEGGTWDKYVTRWLQSKPANMNFVDWMDTFQKEKNNFRALTQSEYNALPQSSKNELKEAVTLGTSPEAQFTYYYTGRGDFTKPASMKPLVPLTVKFYVPKNI